eukprot:10280245-Alexandrium_andersonii.AAC.1
MGKVQTSVQAWRLATTGPPHAAATQRLIQGGRHLHTQALANQHGQKRRNLKNCLKICGHSP